MIRRRASIKRSPIKPNPIGARLLWLSRQSDQTVAEPKSGVALRSSLVESCTCSQGHLHDSRLEARTCDDLHLLERGGQIREIERQITHGLYVGEGVSACTCSRPKGEPMPKGLEKIYSPRLDFQFLEAFTNDTPHGPPIWLLVYADAKGWSDRRSAQFLAYKLFAAIHGQAIRLYKRSK
jgi:hypothetical protein